MNRDWRNLDRKSSFTKSWGFKMLKRSIFIAATIIVLFLAYQQAKDLYLSIKTSDATVIRLCDSTIDKEFRCWCYSEYIRSNLAPECR